MHFLSQLKHIKTFVLDMDGVLTEGGMHIHENGQWIRRMNVRDGYALQLAVKSGFKVVVISGSDSPMVGARLTKLGIEHIFMKVTQKAAFLKEFALANNLALSEMLFMGDDIPDYECMQLVGLACCPADAAPEIISISRYVSPFKGGYGCVRDVIEKVLKLNNKWVLLTTTTST